MTFDAYRALPGVNWTTAKAILRSPLYYQHVLKNPIADKPSMAFGRAAHCAVLEPREFPRRYVYVDSDWIEHPRLSRNNKEGKAFRDRLIDEGHGDVAKIKDADAYKRAVFALEHPGQEAITADDYQRCLDIGDAVRSHLEAGPLLVGDGSNEMVIEWIDERTGIECKGRIDRVSDSPRALVDLKTALTVEERTFGRRARSLGYFGQLAWYADGYEAAAGIALPPVIVSVESEAPYDVAVERFDDLALRKGREEYHAALDLIAWCRKEGKWPGVCPGSRLIWMPERDDDIDFQILSDDSEEEAA